MIKVHLKMLCVPQTYVHVLAWVFVIITICSARHVGWVEEDFVELYGS